MKKSDIFWQTYLNLEKEAIEVSKFIFFTDEVLVNSKNGIVVQSCNAQLETFSPYLADLLIRCCVQIEAISKELYYDNGGTKKRGDNCINSFWGHFTAYTQSSLSIFRYLFLLA